MTTHATPARHHRLQLRRGSRDPGPGRGADRVARSTACRTGRGPDLREAVESHAPLDGDGGQPARRPPGVHPRRGGRLRHTRAGRGRRQGDGGLPRSDCGSGVRPPHRQPDGGRRRRPGGQHALRPLASVAGVRRCVDDAAVPRRPRRQDGCLRRRLQQRRTIARRDLGDAGHAHSFRLPARLRGATGGTRTVRPARSAVGRTVAPSGRGGRGRPCRSHRHLGLDGPGGREAAANAAVRGLHRRHGDDGARRS